MHRAYRARLLRLPAAQRTHHRQHRSYRLCRHLHYTSIRARCARHSAGSRRSRHRGSRPRAGCTAGAARLHEPPLRRALQCLAATGSRSRRFRRLLRELLRRHGAVARPTLPRARRRHVAGPAIRTEMRTLFLQTPSYDGFDGGAGARYQARREIRSYWYPTWLAQLAAMVPNSKLIDAAPHGIGFDEVMTEATQFDLAILHSSTPTFASDVKNAARLKAAKPGIKVGLVGANIAVDPHGALSKAEAVDFVTGKDYDFTVRDVAEGRDFAAIPGLIYRDKNGAIQQTEIGRAS